MQIKCRKQSCKRTDKSSRPRLLALLSGWRSFIPIWSCMQLAVDDLEDESSSNMLISEYFIPKGMFIICLILCETSATCVPFVYTHNSYYAKRLATNNYTALSYGCMDWWRCAGSANGKFDNGYVAEGERRNWHNEAEAKCTPVCRRPIQMHFCNWNVRILIKMTLEFVFKVPINKIPLIQIMAWHRPGDQQK